MGRGKNFRSVEIPDKMFFKIGEVANLVGLKHHVLRYWESEFSVLRPRQDQAGAQRKYTRTDIENILLIKHLVYELRFSIAGAKKRLAEMRGLKRPTEALADAVADVVSDALTGQTAFNQALRSALWSQAQKNLGSVVERPVEAQPRTTLPIVVEFEAFLNAIEV